MSDPYSNIGVSEEDFMDEDPVTSGDPGMESFSITQEKAQRVYNSNISIPFFGADRAVQQRLMNSRMEGPGQGNRPEPLLIRTTDKKNFRIYMRASVFYTQAYINGLCRFLDSRTPDQTVTFILGVKSLDWQTHLLGGIISAMLSCQAPIITLCAGYCSIGETMIWCFGKQPIVYRYGALTFGHTEIVKHCEAYMAYFDQFYAKAVNMRLLTQEEAAHLKSSGTEMMLLSNEIAARMNPQTTA